MPVFNIHEAKIHCYQCSSIVPAPFRGLDGFEYCNESCYVKQLEKRTLRQAGYRVAGNP